MYYGTELQNNGKKGNKDKTGFFHLTRCNNSAVGFERYEYLESVFNSQWSKNKQQSI
jgi:hypothetical protein